MTAFPIRNLLVALVVCAAPMGCAAEYEGPAPVYAENSYQPAYYDNGAVVYYDDVGRPFYYGDGGTIVWITPASPRYTVLVNHWQRYRPAYHHWNVHYGYRYRTYRRR